jgi:ABC-type amino acid transport substrate-binding protein
VVDSSGPLIVATKEAPPFAMKRADGSWEGLSIALWESLARSLNLEFEYRELALPEMLSQVEQGEVDLAVAALTITPDRENRMDFSYSYYNGGLGMAVHTSKEGLIVALLRRLFSWQFLSAVGALSFVLFVAAIFVWLFERHENAEQFGGSHLQGLGASFWWSAVTMTTVGYGDKAPRTVGGRLVALIWMFTSIIIVSSFTAGIASSLTDSQVSTDQLKGMSLDSLSVGTVARSTGDDFTTSLGLRTQSFPDLETALQAVHEGVLQAIVYDLPLLTYHLRNHPEWDVEILPRTLMRESYGIALPPGSPLREPLNRELLEVIRTPEWQAQRVRYVGSN